MRTFLLSFLLITITSFASAQSMEDFLKYKGVKELASLAHPLTKYKGGTYEIQDDKVGIKIEYEGGVAYMILTVNNNFFSDLEVAFDSFSPKWNPFSGVALMRSALYALEEPSQTGNSLVEQLEAAFQKKISEMSGRELALIAINVELFQYYSRY